MNDFVEAYLNHVHKLNLQCVKVYKILQFAEILLSRISVLYFLLYFNVWHIFHVNNVRNVNLYNE